MKYYNVNKPHFVRIVALSLTYVLGLFLLGCSSTGIVSQPTTGNFKDGTNVPAVQTKNPINIVPGRSSLLNWMQKKVGSADFWYVRSVDELHCWVASFDRIHATADGGQSWRTVSLPFAANATTEISGIAITSQNKGWIVSETREKDGPRYSTIYHTEDGGVSWNKQFMGTDVSLAEITAVNDKGAWAVGIQASRVVPITGEFLILRTIDGGETWSKDVNFRSESERGNMHEVSSIVASSSDNATVITGENNIFETQNGGNTWKFSGKVDTGNGTVHLVPSVDGTFSILAGSDGKEGIGSYFLTKQSDGSWLRNHSNSTWLTSVGYAGPTRLFASGSMRTDTSTGLSTRPRDGVVLRSLDNGKTWDISFESRQINRINAIDTSSESVVWAVGDNGLVLRTEIKN